MADQAPTPRIATAAHAAASCVCTTVTRVGVLALVALLWPQVAFALAADALQGQRVSERPCGKSLGAGFVIVKAAQAAANQSWMQPNGFAECWSHAAWRRSGKITPQGPQTNAANAASRALRTGWKTGLPPPIA